MLDNMEGGLTLTLPSGIDINFNKNYSLLLSSDFSDEVSASADPEYEQFLADVWVGIVLTLMVLSCVCCMCSCLLYHKFQQWKRSIIEARNATNNVEAGGNSESESLPSYTVVSGLPSYEEALEQLKKVKEINKVNKEDVKSADNTTEGWIPRTPPTPIATLSVMDLFQKYKNSIPEVHNKPS